MAAKGQVLIGDGVVVGYGATILSGVSIGDGVVIGAGAVVTSDCAPFSIYGGNPAKNIKQRNIDRAEFERFMHCSVEGAYNLLTGQQAEEIEQDADRDNRVVLRIQYLDPVKGGGYGYQVLGALINGEHLPLTEGTDFYIYCMQAKLAPGSELGWDSNPLGLAKKHNKGVGTLNISIAEH